MKYIFVCPDVRFLYIQYKDFENSGNSIVSVGNIRRFAKITSYFKLVNWEKVTFFNQRIYKRIFQKINGGDNYCFVIYARLYESFNNSMFAFLKKNYPESKVVYYFGDLISRHNVDISNMKNNSDKVFTFDKSDAMQFDLTWLLEPFSSSIIKNDLLSERNNPIIWDVTFVGHAKNRYDKIIYMYEILTKNGLKCDFHITGVPKDKRKYADKIGYSPLSFIELLRHVVSSKCVAEVLQENGASPTTRYTEAMLFGRNLLTDCESFKNKEERPQNVFYYRTTDDIEKLNFDDLTNRIDFNREKYIYDFSIEKMILDIQGVLNSDSNTKDD